MKKLLLLLLIGITYSLQAQIEVPETQSSLVTKVTASWCPPCGTWGWAFFEQAIEDNQDKAILFAAHYSGNYMTTESQNLASNFNAAGQPQFFLNNSNLGINSGNGTAKATELMNSIDANAALSPVLNTGIKATKEEGKLTIETLTRFFQATSGDFHLGLYIIEDEVVGFQQGIGASAVHERLVRSEITANTFGTQLMNGDVSVGTEYSGSIEIDIDPVWNLDHVRIVAIIWDKVGNKYNFVNAHEIEGSDIGASVGVANENVLLEKADFNIQPNVSDEEVTVNISVKENIEQAQINLFDLQGRLINTLWNDDLTIGTQQFAISKNNLGLNAGMYLVQMQTSVGTITKKVVFQ